MSIFSWWCKTSIHKIYFMDESLWSDPEVEGSWCIQPSNLPFFHFSIKGKFMAFSTSIMQATKYCCLRQPVGKKKKKRLNGNKRSKPYALQVKFNFAQLILFIFFLILCPIHYGQLVTWKFINLFTNTLRYPVQWGQKRAYFRGGRVMEIE